MARNSGAGPYTIGGREGDEFVQGMRKRGEAAGVDASGNPTERPRSRASLVDDDKGGLSGALPGRGKV